MIGVDDLLELILAGVAPLAASRSDVLASVGCVLVEDLIAVEPLPPFANSAMDGYAVRRDDLAGAGPGEAGFRVVDELPAGRRSRTAIGRGEAAVIATGGMVPTGADVVVPIERATPSGPGSVILRGPVPGHGHIRPAGEDVPAGATLARAGDVVTPGLVALAAAAGVRSTWVVRTPRVGVLTTGDELLPLDAALVPGGVRDVNRLLLTSALESLGMRPVDLGPPVRDTADALAQRLSTLAQVDAVVVSGGLGKGPRDVLVDAVSRIGTIRAFEVAMRPGKPFAVGQVDSRPLFAVPGNPVAAVVAFHILIVPALRRLAGRTTPRSTWSARLTDDVVGDGARRDVLRVRLAWVDGTLRATPVERQGSGVLSSLVLADGLLQIPEGVDVARAGGTFDVIPFSPTEVF